MTAFNELHPVVQERINRYPTDKDGDPWCGCIFGESPDYGKDVQLCLFHKGMLIGVDEALEWVEGRGRAVARSAHRTGCAGAVGDRRMVFTVVITNPLDDDLPLRLRTFEDLKNAENFAEAIFEAEDSTAVVVQNPYFPTYLERER